MRWWCIALVVVAGCDKLFDVDLVDQPHADAPADPETFFDAPEPCPNIYKEWPEAPAVSRYRWVGQSITWAEAQADCEDDTRTRISHLLVFDQPGEMSIIRDHLVGMFGGFNSHAGYARDVLEDPFQFYAVTGEPIPRSGAPWNANEPTGIVGAGEETTTRFESGADLTDQPWSHPVSYVCECDHRPVTKTFMLTR